MKPHHPSVRQAITECRSLLWGAFWCGLFINVLMLAVPLYSLQVLDRVLSSGSVDTLLMLTIMAGAALIFMGIMQTLRSLTFNHIGRWLDDRLAGDIIERMLERAINKPKIGSQPLRDLAMIRGFVTSPHLANLFDAPWASIYLIVIYLIHPIIGVMVTLGGLVLLILAIITERLPQRSLASANDEQIRSMQTIDAILRNAEAVKSMGLLPNAKTRWQAHNQTALDNTFSAGNQEAVVTQITRTLRLALQIGVMGVGAWFSLLNEMSPGAIIAISILTSRALAPFDAATPVYQRITGLKKAMKQLDDLDRSAAVTSERMVMPEPSGALAVNAATYGNPERKAWILRGVNFELEAGNSLGVVGPSGSGKTTLARIISGVVTPNSGVVRLDGAALHQWDLKQLGMTIGYLPQTVELFDGTIAQNIARLDTDASDERVIEAAQNAQVHQAILSFPNGYHTDIGPNGCLLSAGQRQRIALARCFYGSPKLMVLDEPNANLDRDGELAFVQALNRAKELRITTVTIVHRPSILQHVDKVLVLHAGETRLFGPAKQILAELAKGASNVRPITKAEEGGISS